MNARETIARRTARELKMGDLVNLGIGMPTMVANFIPKDVQIILQSENGFLGMGPSAAGRRRFGHDQCGESVCHGLPGGAFFDSAMSFAIIRGGHVDVTVLGAGSGCPRELANWIIPGKMVPGMGGAMDIAVGAKRVIIATEHRSKAGNRKS